MGLPFALKITLKGYLEHQKAMPRGPDQASIYDELGVRMCCFCCPLPSVYLSVFNLLASTGRRRTERSLFARVIVYE